MTVLLSPSAVAFAAFCMWLTARIVNRRERWAKWTLAATLGVPVLYVASFGPACWLVRAGTLPVYATARAFQPIVEFSCEEPPIRRNLPATILRWYADRVDEGWVDLMWAKLQPPEECRGCFYQTP